jgi:histidinol phosphatase-like PHP family hydrolase
MKYLDCHNHTAEWSDGRQSIEQVVEKARLEGVRVGLADHAGLSDYLNSNDRLLAYADFLSQYPVARGYEMDLGRSFMVHPSTREKFDYMIGSVHGLEVEGDRVSFSHVIAWSKGKMPDYDPMAQIKNLEKFLKTHLALLEKEFSGQKYDILGHPTLLPPLALGKPEDVFPEWWEDQLLAILLKHGVAMELSNRWKTPYDRLMKKGLEAGVKLSLGSDGHEPDTSCVLDYPKEMMKKFGVEPGRLFDVSRPVETV